MQPVRVYTLNWVTAVGWQGAHCTSAERGLMTQFMVSSHCILLVDMIGCDAMSESAKPLCPFCWRQEICFALNRILQSIPDSYSIYSLKDNGNKKNVARAKRFSANMKEIMHQSVRLISGLRTPKLKWKKKFYRSVLVTEYNVLFNLPRVYSQILRVGKLLFAAWKETGCAYLWMKGLAQTLHPNKDHDPIWLPRHMVLFLRHRESVADSHLGRTE